MPEIIAEKDSPFGKLPEEMKRLIFGYLSIDDKKEARKVCRDWSRTINSTVKFYAVLNEENTKYILASKVNFEKIYVQDMVQSSLPCSSTRNNFMDTLKKLTLSENYPGISEINLAKVFHLSGNVQKLTIQTLTLRNSERLCQTNAFAFNKVKTLKLKLFTYERNHHNSVKALLELAKFPALTAFSLEFTNTSKYQLVRHLSCYPSMPFQKIYLSALRFCQAHKTITHLFLCEPMILQFRKGVPAFDRNLQQEVITVSVTHMSLFFGVYDRENPIWDLRMHLITGNVEMKSIHMCGHPLPDGFQSLIKRNQSTLENLTWISDTIYQTNPPPSFDFASVAKSQTLNAMYICTSKVFNLELIPKQLTQLVWATPICLEDLLWLTKNMLNLQTFTLEDCFQLDEVYDIPLITLQIFKKLINMPKLANLNLCCLSTTTIIESFCSVNRGLCFTQLGSVNNITIDRAIFVLGNAREANANFLMH